MSRDHPGPYGPGYGQYYGQQGYPGVPQPDFPILRGQPQYGAPMQPQGVLPPHQYAAVGDHGTMGQWGLPPIAQSYDQHGGDSHGYISVDRFSSSRSKTGDRKSQATDDADRKQEKGYSKSSDKQRNSSSQDDRTSSYDGHPRDDQDSSRDRYPSDDHASHSRDGDGKKSTKQKEHDDRETSKLARQNIDAMLQDEQLKNILFAGISKATAKLEQSLKSTDKKLENYESTDDSTSRHKAQQSAQTSSADVPQKPKSILKRKTGEERVDVESKVSTESQVSSDPFSKLSALEKTLHLLCGKTNVEDVVRGSGKGSGGSEKPSFKPVGTLSQLESYNDSGDDNDHAEKDTKKQTKTKKNAPNTRPFWSADAVPTGKEKDKESELPDIQEQLYEQWRKSINLSSKVHQTTSKEQDVNQLSQQTGEAQNLASSSETKKSGDDEEELDSTVQNILQSIGFNFDLSKRMQELARQKKKQQDILHTGMINQSASFLEQSEGLVQDVRSALFSDKQEKAQLDSLIKEARASMQQRSSYERSASPDALSAEDQRGKSSYGRKGRNAVPDDGRGRIGLGSRESRSDQVLENFSSQDWEHIRPDTFSSEAQRGGKKSRKGKGPETDDGTSKMDLGSREIRDDRILKKLNSQDWEDISPDEDDMGERVSLKKIENMRRLYEKQAEVRQQSVSRERDAASPPHSNLLDEAQKLRNMLLGGHEKSLWLSERFRDEPKDEYLYRDDSDTSKVAALFAALSSKRKEVPSSSSKSLKLPLQSGSVRVENLRVTSRTVHSGDDEPCIESRKVILPSKSDVRIVSQSPVFRKSHSPETKVPRKRPASPPLFPVSKERRVFSERGSINDLQAFLRRSLEENAPEICQALGLNVDSYYKSPMLQNVFGGLNVGGQPVAKRLESPVMSDHFNRDSVRKSPDRQRLRSPDVRTSRSPRRRLSRSPKRQNSRSPVRQMPWSPGRRTSKSTDRWKSRSPDRHLSMSPKRRKSVSPGRHTSRSPDRRRSISLERRRSRSPDRRRSRSPDRRRSRSPDKRRFKSPDRRRSKSPYRQRSRSPDRRRSKSPDRRRSRSPDRQRSRSPGSQRSRSTNRQRSKSPAMHGYRSLEHHKSRSPARIRSPLRARPRSPGRRRSITPPVMPSRTRPPDRLKQFAKHKFPVRERRTPPKNQTTAFKRQLPADKKLNANRGTQSKMSNTSDKINQPAKTYVSATFEEGGKELPAAQSKEMSEVQKKGPQKEQPKEHVYELPKAQDKEPKKGQEKEPETGQEEQLKNYIKTEIDILGEFPVDERKIKREDPQVPSVPRSLVSQEKVYYEYYDSGNHFCRHCSFHFSSLEQLLEHNHTDKHLSMIKTLKKPWKSAEEKQPKRKVGLSRSRQIKGAEMMFPLQGFFCSLCLEFLGDMEDAANHLKDDQHYDQYMDFVKKNPIYEKTLLLDKTGVHVKMKFSQLIDPEPPLSPEEEYPGRGSKTVGEQQPKVKASRKNLSVKDASAESDFKNATKDNIEVVDMDLENEAAAKQNIVKVPRLMKPLVVIPTWIPQVTEVPRLEVDMKMTKEDDNHHLDEFLTIGKDSAQLDQVPLPVVVETEFDFLDIPMPEDLSPLLDIPMPEESSPSPEDLETPTESTLKYTVKSQQEVREEKSKNPSLPTKDLETPTEPILASLSHTVKSRWELRKEKSGSIVDEKRPMGIDVDEIEKPMSAVVIITPSVTQTPLSVAANVQDGMKFNKLEEAVQALTTQTNPQPEELKQAQAADSTLAVCFHKLLKAHSPPHSGEMYMKNGLLYRRAGKGGLEHAQLIVPSSYRAQILDMGHSLPFCGHMGISITTHRISTHFYWPRMNIDIARYVKSCFHCQREAPKQRTAPTTLGEIPITGTPFEKVAMDIVGPLNRTKRRNCYILTLVDNCSMWAEAVPMPSTDSKHIAEALIGIFTRLGYPLSIIIHNGSQFRKKLMEEVLRLFQSQQNHTSLFHSASNATVERFNNTLISILRKLAYEKPETWDTYVPAASFAYMEVPHHLTGYAPATLLFGRPFKGPLEALFRTWTDDKADESVVTVSTYVAELKQCMQRGWKISSDNPRKARRKIARYYKKKPKGSELEVGEKVMLLLPASQNKLQISWKGPYEVIEQISHTNYRISIRGKHKFFHINSLRKYNERPTT